MPALTLPEYQPFPNEGARNWRQEHVEIPLMVAALSLPRGARVLEVGCGRGIALPVLDRYLTPTRLVGAAGGSRFPSSTAISRRPGWSDWTSTGSCWMRPDAGSTAPGPGPS
jgi:hypothetical protein